MIHIKPLLSVLYACLLFASTNINAAFISNTETLLDDQSEIFTVAEYSIAKAADTEDLICVFDCIGNAEFNNGKTVDFKPDNLTVSAVPVPPSVWLFCSGLMGLVVVARRKPVEPQYR